MFDAKLSLLIWMLCYVGLSLVVNLVYQSWEESCQPLLLLLSTFSTLSPALSLVSFMQSYRLSGTSSSGLSGYLHVAVVSVTDDLYLAIDGGGPTLEVQVQAVVCLGDQLSRVQAMYDPVCKNFCS